MSVCGPYSNRSPTRRGRTQRTAGSPRQYEDYHDSAYLPYLNAPGPLDDITEVPRLRVSFGERSYSVVMDLVRAPGRQ
jgi:hypothetical protein